MVVYLLKRLLFLLPTIWLILTLLFLVSKLIPDSYYDLKLNSLQEQNKVVISNKAQEKIISENLERYGANKPVFYFSVKSAVEPETLETIYPITDRSFLKQQLLRRGNWDLLQKYYQQAKKLQLLLIRTNDPTVWHLTQQANNQKLELAFHQLKKKYRKNIHIHDSILKTEAAFLAFKNSGPSFKRLLPVIQFHGSANQYHNWFTEAITGDLGKSYRTNRAVSEIIIEALGNTIFLMLASFIIICVLSIELSMYLVKNGNQKFKTIILSSLRTIDSIPVFLIALSLLFFFAQFEYIPLFPINGLPELKSVGLVSYMSGYIYYLAIPVFCLVVARLPYFVIQLYYALINILDLDYIKTAKAKGLSEQKVLRYHALQNALLPLITALTEYVPGLIAGSLVIEIIFAIPGIGRLLAESVLSRDYPVVLGIVFLVAILKILSNILADILYYAADPKIKLT